jgi:hypothetical protein
MKLILSKSSLTIIILLNLSCLLNGKLYAQNLPFSDSYGFVGGNIEIPDATIAGLEGSVPASGNIDIGSQSEETLPLSVERINEDSIRVTIGRENGSQVIFSVGSNGLYDAEGVYRGDKYSFSLGRGQFSVSVEDGYSALSFKIKEDSGADVVFRQDFDWDDLGLAGEFEVKINSEGPSFVFKVNNPDHLNLDGSIFPDGGDIRGRVGFLGAVGMDIMRVDGKWSIEGDLGWDIGDGYRLSLSLGDIPRIEITEKEIKDAEDDLLANGDVREAAGEWYGGEMSSEDARDIIRDMVDDLINGEGGDVLSDMANGSSSDKLESVPESLSLFLALGSDPKIGGKFMEIVMPLIARKLALELSLGEEGPETKLIFSFNQLSTGDGIERGIVGIALQHLEEDAKGVFTVTDSRGVCSAEVVTSFARGLERVYLAAERGGLKAIFDVKEGYDVTLSLDDSVLGLGIELSFGSQGFGYIGFSSPGPFGLGDIKFGYGDEKGYIGYSWGERDDGKGYLELILGSKIVLDFGISFGSDRKSE